jgi:uncharacterized protein YndB with AHSA1/START domain
MGMQRVEVREVIPAPPQVVWDRYTDHVSWTQWAGIGKVRLVREGEPPPNGVGCVRAISSGGVEVQEEVVSFEPPRRMTYRLIKGAVPLRDHFGEVTFEPHADGTLVTWRCQFQSRIPGLGGLSRLFITRLFRTALTGLSRTFHC